MSPSDLSMSPSRMRKKVVFPQPLAPTMATNSPSSICRLMSRSASTSPPVALTKVFDRPRVSSFGMRLILELEVPPGGHAGLDPLQELDAQVAADGEHEHAH